MTTKFFVEAIPNVPFIDRGDNVGTVISDAAREANFKFEDNDIICVSSKAVSFAEGQTLNLNTVTPSSAAIELHKKIPRKSPEVLQVIMDETGAKDASRLEVSENYIAGWRANGYRLTSSGVDKLGSNQVVLLPKNPDQSAKNIGLTILENFGVRVGVIITDSDGRVEKAGSTQVAVGLYGVPALRESESVDEKGNTKVNYETFCDLISATSALIMGQRGNNKPAVVVRGLHYEFDESSQIRNALSRPE